MRGEQQQLVRDLSELIHPAAALRAVGDVLKGATARLALDDAERQLGCQLACFLATRVHQFSTSSSSRSLIIAVRIRVFTVPRGTSSRSLISRAVLPMYAARTRARRWSSGRSLIAERSWSRSSGCTAISSAAGSCEENEISAAITSGSTGSSRFIRVTSMARLRAIESS